MGLRFPVINLLSEQLMADSHLRHLRHYVPTPPYDFCAGIDQFGKQAPESPVPGLARQGQTHEEIP